MRVHVTGGSGFLGSHVVTLLVAAGHEVTALARSGAAAQKVTAAGAEAIAGDLDDPASIDEAFAASGAKVLVNLASLGFGHAPAIVAAAEEAGMGRAVFVSTTAVATTLDSRSKAVRLAAEATVRASGLDWTILRPTMIYGSTGDRNMGRLLRLVRRAPVVPVPGGGRRLQQPVHVDDLAAAVVAAITAPSAVGQVYDIAGPEPLTLRDVVLQAGDAVGRRPRLVDVPLARAIGLARAYERVASKPRLKAEQLQRLDEDKAFDIGPARRDLGYDPRPFALGIREEADLLA
ncbi:MAG: hypothetical protein QOG43_3313 [Actinomycetota bacterium]|nr:hypothetical protein [Actinomycetota bacterium]